MVLPGLQTLATTGSLLVVNIFNINKNNNFKHGLFRKSCAKAESAYRVVRLAPVAAKRMRRLGALRCF